MAAVPLRRFGLFGPAITRLRFEADNHHFEGFANLVLDQLVLAPQ
jgi:hypothetical protein